MNKNALDVVEHARRVNLRRYMEQTEQEQQAIAKRLGVTSSYISQVLKGTRPFNEKTAREFERKLRLRAFSLDVLEEESGTNSRRVTPVADKELREVVKETLDELLLAIGADVSKARYRRAVEILYKACRGLIDRG